MNYYEARQIICRTKVRVLNKTNSKAIQEKLFSLGCKWEGSESKNKIIKNLDKPFLYTSTGGQIIRWGTSEKVFDKSDYDWKKTSANNYWFSSRNRPNVDDSLALIKNWEPK